MTTQTIPNLFDVTDLIAIESWQAPVMPDTDVTLLPNDVYMYDNGLLFCVVIDGKIVEKNISGGAAFRILYNFYREAPQTVPFQGEYSLAVMESEE